MLAGKPNVSVMCCDSPNLGLVVPTMSLGGQGTANMTGNIAPAELAAISTPWRSYAEAENFKRTYLRMLPLLHFTYSAINPVAVKSLMKAVGLPAGDLRKPLTRLEGEALAKGCASSRSSAWIGNTATSSAQSRPLPPRRRAATQTSGPRHPRDARHCSAARAEVSAGLALRPSAEGAKSRLSRAGAMTLEQTRRKLLPRPGRR